MRLPGAPADHPGTAVRVGSRAPDPRSLLHSRVADATPSRDPSIDSAEMNTAARNYNSSSGELWTMLLASPSVLISGVPASAPKLHLLIQSCNVHFG